MRLAASTASIDSRQQSQFGNLMKKTKTRLRVRAAHHDRSIEVVAREILRSALRTPPAITENLSDTTRRRFAEFGGVELDLASRDEYTKSIEFS